MKLGEIGFNIVINYHSDSSKKLLDKMIETLETKYKVKGYGIQVDVSQYEGCKKIVDFAVEKFNGKIDVLANNAGILNNNVSFTKISNEEYMSVINTNFFGTFHMLHLVVPYMVKEKKGCIINNSSVGGLMGVAGEAD